MRRTIFVLAGVAILSFGARADDQELPPGPNRALVYGQCRTCHDLQYLTESAGIPRDAWAEAIDSMSQYGWRPSSTDQRDKILDYLATYLGPDPPPVAKTAPAAAGAKVDGAAIFAEQCAACHQANGQGVAGQFPPLAGNADLFLDRPMPTYVVLFGIEGHIEVGGKSYNGAMPPFGHLNDREVAAVVNYIRDAWLNGVPNRKYVPVTAAEVKAIRETKLSPAAVLAYRNRLR